MSYLYTSRDPAQRVKVAASQLFIITYIHRSKQISIHKDQTIQIKNVYNNMPNKTNTAFAYLIVLDLSIK